MRPHRSDALITVDDDIDLPPVPDRWAWLWLAGLGAATGAVAGGLEVLGLGLSMKLEMSWGEMIELALGTLSLDAAVGFACGLAGGVLAQVLPRRVARWKRYRLGFAVGTQLLALFFLVPFARTLWMADRREPAAGMIALAMMFGALGWYNGAYWFRRTLIGAAPRVGWSGIGPAIGFTLAAFATLLAGPSGPKQPLTAPGMPNLVLFTIDTLRRDHIGLYGNLVNTPRIDTLGKEGVIFDDAITSLPETLPSHTSMLTGLQPAETGILSNGAVLRNGYQTVTEQLAASGYRTGAFVSSFAVDADTGLDQGFQVYDDDFFPFLRGITQVRAAGVALPLLMRFGNPASFPFLLERGTPETLRRALHWVDEGDGTRPFFLWVHIFDPHAPYEPRDGSAPKVDHRAILAQEPGYPYTDEERTVLKDYYRQECEYADSQVGVLFDELKSRGALDHALFVVAADHGESLGEHGINFAHHGIYDDTVRVPLVAWAAPAVQGPSGPVEPGTRVERMVNVADIANTLMDYSGLPLIGGTNSVPLLTHVRGVDVPAKGVLVSGREGASLTEGQLCGVRSPAGLKYIRHQDGREEYYDLKADPGELVDIAKDQPLGLERGRESVTDCVGAGPVKGPVDKGDCERLKAMGYVSGDCE